VVGSVMNRLHCESEASDLAKDAGIAPYPTSCPGFSASPRRVGKSTVTLTVIEH
jgi:hypothetical protein